MGDRSRYATIFLQILLFSLMAALLGRLFYLQVAATEKYQDAALEIQSRNVVTPATRGMILDSGGKPLALNRVGLVITADRSILDKEPDRGVAALKETAKALKMSYEEVFGKTRLCGEKVDPSLTGGARCWNGSRYQPIPVSVDASEEIALAIVEHAERYPGVNASPQGFRYYPGTEGVNGAHLLGYVGPVSENELAASTSKKYYLNEYVGKAGLEKVYDADLRGAPGVKTIVVDRKESVTSTLKETKAIPGNHLVTSIDAKLQAVVERELVAAITRARAGVVDKKGPRKADSGAAVVMDVKTGRILAIASYPNYNPNIWERGITAKQAKDLFSTKTGVPALSRALQGTFAPASAFKVVSVAAAAKAGYDLNGKYDCPAEFQVGNRTFRNYESKGAGRITLEQGIAISCDTLWYEIAYNEWLKDGGLRPNKERNDYFYNAAAGFNLGKRTGIDLPSESAGRLADRQWRSQWHDRNKDFYCNYEQRAKKSQLTPYLIAIAKENCVDGGKIRAGDAVNFAIGQGDTTMTPLQMAQIYAAIANGGTMWKPTVGRAIITPTGELVREIAPEKAGTLPVSKKTMAFLKRSLRAVITSGTAQWRFAGMPIAVSGKTGTGEVYGKNPDGSNKDTTSWFASYAPSDAPRYAVVMMISQGGTGSGTSGPSIRRIYEAIFGVQGQKIVTEQAIFPSAPPSQIPRRPKVDQP